jgi:hypothetical protein
LVPNWSRIDLAYLNSSRDITKALHTFADEQQVAALEHSGIVSEGDCSPAIDIDQ